MLESVLVGISLQMVSRMWELRYLPLALQNPVPKDIEIARSQTPKNVLELTQEIGLLPSEVSCCYGLTW